ncbi:Serine protease 55, partial [Lamprotornis superbus]
MQEIEEEGNDFLSTSRVLTEGGFGSITTEIREAPEFYYAEEYHQQYLSKNPGCGLRPSYESFQKTGKRTGTGTDIKPGEFPWLVSIQSHGKHICGGTIISALWILTAAHCFVKELPPDLTVAVGGVDLNLPLEEHNPDSLILHEEFNRTSLQNDIALILLSNPIEFSKEKIPACLPFVCDMDTWQHCWAAGWENTSTAFHVMQKTQMKLISKEKCLEQIPHLVGSVMCAETERGGGGGGGGGGRELRQRLIFPLRLREAAALRDLRLDPDVTFLLLPQVDSGGPLVCSYWNTMKWFQVGIISGGKPDHRDAMISSFSIYEISKISDHDVT